MEELDGTEKNTLKIFKSITLVHEAGMVTLEVSGHQGLLLSALSLAVVPAVPAVPAFPAVRPQNRYLLGWESNLQPALHHVLLPAMMWTMSGSELTMCSSLSLSGLPTL